MRSCGSRVAKKRGCCVLTIWIIELRRTVFLTSAGRLFSEALTLRPRTLVESISASDDATKRSARRQSFCMVELVQLAPRDGWRRYVAEEEASCTLVDVQ